MMKKRGRKKVLLLGGAALIVLVAAVVALVLFQRVNALSALSFEEMLAYTTAGRADAVISVAVVRGEDVEINVYGADGVLLAADGQEYEYEIGSVTKTFTGALLCKAVAEGKLTLADAAGGYLGMPEAGYTPTLARLVTHTSGYKGFYFDRQMARNFFNGEDNDFYGVGGASLRRSLAKIALEDRNYPFRYSNFGIAVVGAVLEAVYATEYETLMNTFIREDLGLSRTGIGELAGGWHWRDGDAYLPAGAIVSTIGDMAHYLQLQMTEALPYLALGQEQIAVVDGNTMWYEKMGIRIDGAGVCWLLDGENRFLWHNGGTGNFNSYIAFDREKQVGVVILSNLPPGYRIPATVMGAKLIVSLQQ